VRDEIARIRRSIKVCDFVASRGVALVLALICVFCAGWGGLEQSPTSDLLPFSEDGRAGYLNVRTGEWAIRPQFKAAQSFSEGLAAVQVGASWGYINEKGAIVIQPTFQWAGPFHEGIALVNDLREGIYISKSGKAIASTELGDGERPLFSNGRGLILAKGKWGYMDDNGTIVIDPVYAQARPFFDGVAPVGTGKGWQLIDLSGKVRSGGGTGMWGFSDARTGQFSEGLAVAMSTQPPGNLGYVDTNGVTVMEANFMEAGRFSEGVAEVRGVEHVGANAIRAGPVGYINRSGQYVIPPRFAGGHEFSDGLAAVAVDGKWGYIDKSPAMVISPWFADAGAFSRGLALVFVDDQSKSTNSFEQTRKDPKLGCINKKGEFVWGPKAVQDRRSLSERMLDSMVAGAVAGLRRGDQGARDKVEEEMKKLPSTAVPLLKDYESTAEPELRERIQRVRAYLSGDSKATEERLMSVVQKWGGSEYDVRPYTDGGYEVVINSHSVVDLSPLKGLPIKSLSIVSSGVRDLLPLAGMPLEKLAVNGSCDLTATRGLPLKELGIESGTNDLKSLTGLGLRKLVLSQCMVTNLVPLSGMPLKELVLHALPVADLGPLEGLTLTNLVVSNCRRVTDLSFVKGMPLESISFDERRVTNGLSELRELHSLKGINGKPAEQFWKRQDVLEDLTTRMQTAGIEYKHIEVDDAGLCFVQLETNTATDLSALKGAPIKALSMAGTEVDDVTPLGSMPLEAVRLPEKRMTKGIDTIRKMPGIKEINGQPAQRFWRAYDSVANEVEWRRMLDTRNVKYSTFRVTDEGKVILNLNGTMTSDLSGLEGMPVNNLFMQSAKVTDLSPLRGMPLTELWAEDSLVSELSALEGMQITSLNLRGSPVKDLSPLRGMPLRRLYLMDTQVEDLSALSGMPLYELNISNTKVRDLSPLKYLPLGKLVMSRAPVMDLSPLKGMKIAGLFINVLMERRSRIFLPSRISPSDSSDLRPKIFQTA
jgi:Leucine-rich repeat (LRR) protein